MSLTFAIPFFKGRDWLKKAIDSVRQQTFSNWTLIVVNDGDDAEDIESEITKYNDSRIRYFKNPENRGMVANWNHCLELCDTDLVTLLHADDELKPNYGKLMLDVASKFPDAAAFFCRAEIIDANSNGMFSFPDYYKSFLEPFEGNKPLVLQGEKAAVSLLKGNYIMCPTLCYRLTLLNGARFDGTWKQVQDLEFTLRLLRSDKKIVGVPDLAYRYRRHASSATSTNNANVLRFQEEESLFNKIATEYESAGWVVASKVARKKNIMKLNLLFCIVRETLEFKFKSAFSKLKFLSQLK